MTCKNRNCGKEHDGSYGSGSYCSYRCSRSRNWTKEVNEKRSAAVRQAHVNHRDKFENFRIASQDPRTVEKRKQALRRLWDSVPFENLGYDGKKKRVLQEQKGRCAICGISDWCGKPLSLHLDHIDGDTKNVTRENLRGLCPNCHSQTETYCGKRGGTKGKVAVSYQTLKDAVITSESMSQALRKVGLNENSATFYLRRF